MRTIKLSHDDIELLINSLFIAAGEYMAQFRAMLAKFPDDKDAGKYWIDKANAIDDLACKIRNGEFDV